MHNIITLFYTRLQISLNHYFSIVRFISLIVLLNCVLNFWVLGTVQKGPIVQTQSGYIQGVVMETTTGRKVDVFLGIPYAKPPTRELRFSPPLPVQPWKSVLNAQTSDAYCLQMDDVPFQKEDCLNLNIWVPWNVSNHSAVMVWIHGDSYLAGSANQPLYNGAKLATQENVIVVALNYRLAMFGFLFLDLPEAPGNVGLMDQEMALRWIRLNIWRFNGDPNNVTLFGASAGASSIGLHFFIPSSNNLFQRAILQSGGPITPWAYTHKTRALDLSLALAKIVNCPFHRHDRHRTLDCLIQKDASLLISAAFSLDFFDVCFGPTADGKYIAEDPVLAIERGDYNRKKEVLIGTIQHDAAKDLNVHFSKRPMSENSSYTYNDFETVAFESLKSLSYFMDRNVKTSFLSKVIALEYSKFDADRCEACSRNNLIHLTTDFNFLCPAEKFADQLADAGDPVYRYLFQHPSSDPTRPQWVGSVHYDELPFVFGDIHHINNSENATAQSRNDEQLTKTIMKYWANFAKHGDPNYGQKGNGTCWPRYYSHSKKYLLMQANPSVGIHYRRKICAFWNKLIPDLINSLSIIN